MAEIVFIPTFIQAMVFDYGNTVVPFGRREITECDAALAQALHPLYGPPDLEQLANLRAEDRMAPYRGSPPEYRENHLPEITARTVRTLYGRDATPKDVEALILARFNAFVESIRLPDEVAPLLRRLAGKYRLALCSNYPDGDAIRASLARTGLDAIFDPVVVSADYGRVKPHPLLFEEVQRRLELPPERIAFVGDNWLADVQGAARAGFWPIWCTQWEAPEDMPRSPDDIPPAAVIQRLTDLSLMAGLDPIPMT